MCDEDDLPELYWDSTYAIAITLLERYSSLNPSDVGILELADLVSNLPNFRDDPAFATERILLDIQTVWYEEQV